MDVKYNQTASQTDITNTTINITGNTGGLNLSTANNGFVRMESVGASGLITIKASDIVMRDNLDTLHFDQDQLLTVIRNTTINLRDVNNTTRFSQNNGTTTITNTDVDVVGTLNITQGGDNINMIGNNLGGLFTAYYPEGAGAGRKAYLGYPTTSSRILDIHNEYSVSGSQIQLNVNYNTKATMGLTSTTFSNTTMFINANGFSRISLEATRNFYFFNQSGTTAQRWQLYDNGEPNRMYLLQGAANNGVQLVPGAGAWSSWSDERVKKNIVSMDTELDNVLKLKPVFYNYKGDDDTQPKRVGFIAQEIRQIYPELVDEGEMSVGDVDNVLSLETTSLIPYLVKAIQDLNKKIEEQSKIINELISKSI